MLVEEVFRHLLVAVVSTLHVRASGRLFCDYPGTSRVTVRRLWMPVVACSFFVCADALYGGLLGCVRFNGMGVRHAGLIACVGFSIAVDLWASACSFSTSVWAL